MLIPTGVAAVRLDTLPSQPSLPLASEPATATELTEHERMFLTRLTNAQAQIVGLYPPITMWDDYGRPRVINNTASVHTAQFTRALVLQPRTARTGWY